MGVGQAPRRPWGDAVCVTVWTPEGVEMDSQGQLLAFVRSRDVDAVLWSTHGNAPTSTDCLCTIDVVATLARVGLACALDGEWGDYRVRAEGGAP